MPTLHGFAYSNYYNMPKHALLYKGVPFEEDLVYPSAQDYGQLSPALKVPSLTTDDGQHLSEASVLCEYIEDTYPDKPLLPTTPMARNKNRQLMRMTELYLELPNRRLLPFSFSNQPAPEALITEVIGHDKERSPCRTAGLTFSISQLTPLILKLSFQVQGLTGWLGAAWLLAGG